MQAIYSEIDKKHVEERLHDWKKRVSELYSCIELWLEDTPYTLKPGTRLMMFEEMMSKYGVPKTYIDTVDIYKGKQPLACLKPRGLWIIGVNGSIDLLTIRSNYVIGDVAEQFCVPKWMLLRGYKGKSTEFTKQALLEILDKVS
ncbi:MAG: hypothetical protein ACK45R_05180 [Candidatus Kapaibacterium sp.]|jgi:hypothetical protein